MPADSDTSKRTSSLAAKRSERRTLPQFVGILNLTPDSFSDGGRFSDVSAAIAHAERLLEQGADMIEIGGDSTRPGSVCVGPEVEWSRIEPVLLAISKFATISVDTHHALVAERALKLGAVMINDISCAYDPAMFSVVSGSEARLVLMYSRCKMPHDFEHLNGAQPSIEELIYDIKNCLRFKAQQAEKAGVWREQIVLDIGLGAFLSQEAENSYALVERYEEFLELGYPLMLACSRKGFLKKESEVDVSERDITSAELAFKCSKRTKLAYIRSHNVLKLKQLFV